MSPRIHSFVHMRVLFSLFPYLLSLLLFLPSTLCLPLPPFNFSHPPPFFSWERYSSKPNNTSHPPTPFHHLILSTIHIRTHTHLSHLAWIVASEDLLCPATKPLPSSTCSRTTTTPTTTSTNTSPMTSFTPYSRATSRPRPVRRRRNLRHGRSRRVFSYCVHCA